MDEIILRWSFDLRAEEAESLPAALARPSLAAVLRLCPRPGSTYLPVAAGAQ